MDTDSLISYFSKINMNLMDKCTTETLAEIVRKHAAAFGENPACDYEIQSLAAALRELGCRVEMISCTAPCVDSEEQRNLLNVQCPDEGTVWIVDVCAVGLPLRYEFGNWQGGDNAHFTFAQSYGTVELVRWDENLDSIVCTFEALAA